MSRSHLLYFFALVLSPSYPTPRFYVPLPSLYTSLCIDLESYGADRLPISSSLISSDKFQWSVEKTKISRSKNTRRVIGCCAVMNSAWHVKVSGRNFVYFFIKLKRWYEKSATWNRVLWPYVREKICHCWNMRKDCELQIPRGIMEMRGKLNFRYYHQVVDQFSYENHTNFFCKVQEISCSF